MFLFFFAIVVYSISCSTDADCVSFNDPLNRCEVPFCRFSVCSVRLLNDNQCPGACCMANGACGDDDMKDEPWCVADGGVFQGVSTFCSNVTCPQCDACPTLQNTAVSSPTFTTANN